MKQLKPRDKITQKMSRDGLFSENQTTGETERISKREQEADLQKTPEQQAAQDAVQLTPPFAADTSPSPRVPDTPISQSSGLAGRVLNRADVEITRKASKKAARKKQRETTAREKSSRLQFTDEERAAPELEKYIEKSDKAADKLDAARAAIPKKKLLTKERTFDETTGKAKMRLHFEEVDKPAQNLSAPGGKLKHNPLSRPAQEAGLFIHNKIHSVEKDNSGVEGAHKSEELAERGAKYGARKLKQGYRSHKLKPYRAASKAEKAAAKANVNFQYHKALSENPQLTSNPVSRFLQKRQIKKQYAKNARNVAKTAKETAVNTAKTVQKTTAAVKNTAAFVGRNWKVILIIASVLLLFIMIFAAFSSCSAMLAGGLNSIVSTSYISEDKDMLETEADYTTLEAALQSKIDNIEQTHSGYDEYRYNLDEIKHDPYVLTSILTALQPGYLRADVQSTIQKIFNEQYILTLTEEVEVRYRTEIRIDSEGNSYSVQVPYNYYILNVHLENFDLSHIPVYIMTDEQLSMYATYMKTLGNRPDLFPNGIYPNASTIKKPEYYDIPPEAQQDETFKIIITEAEKYLGYPYVWGGSSPKTSFDCSGFVSWVINHSGWNVGRLGAQGLYNICTPVSSANVKPGDLVFFVGTYNTPGVSHCGIYVGNNRMIHCGDPISYTNLNANYWQQHFYAFGRLP